MSQAGEKSVQNGGNVRVKVLTRERLTCLRNKKASVAKALLSKGESEQETQWEKRHTLRAL